ncbi:hypothetical protein RJT34_12555 [Clitoria ternatea]|uniref:Uncharacterized protein n=1 Tax=Clitoria ternatea TaxID=43366 RepID=A0AAN9PL10_CLITE
MRIKRRYHCILSYQARAYARKRINAFEERHLEETYSSVIGESIEIVGAVGLVLGVIGLLLLELIHSSPKLRLHLRPTSQKPWLLLSPSVLPINYFPMQLIWPWLLQPLVMLQAARPEEPELVILPHQPLVPPPAVSWATHSLFLSLCSPSSHGKLLQPCTCIVPVGELQQQPKPFAHFTLGWAEPTSLLLVLI